MNEQPKVLYQFLKEAGKPFRPCNGTEGCMFEASFCAKCTGDAQHRLDQTGGCQILGAAYAHDIGDDGYPEEWRFNDDGWPTCLAFEPVND